MSPAFAGQMANQKAKVSYLKELIKEPMLWKVVAPDGREHYLLGTSHDLVPTNFFPEALSVLRTVVDGVDYAGFFSTEQIQKAEKN